MGERFLSVGWSKDLNNLMATTRFSTDLMIPRGLILLTFTSSNTTMRLTFGGLNEILQLSEGLALNLGHNFHLLYFTQPLSDVDVAARNYCCITILCIFFCVCVFSEMGGREDAQKLWLLTRCSSRASSNSFAQRKSTGNSTRLIFYLFLKNLYLFSRDCFCLFALHVTKYWVLGCAFCSGAWHWFRKNGMSAYSRTGISNCMVSAALSAFFLVL